MPVTWPNKKEAHEKERKRGQGERYATTTVEQAAKTLTERRRQT